MKHSKLSSSFTKIGFLLIPEFSMFSLASLIEPLRMANQLSGKTLYHWYVYGHGEAVHASNGFPFFVSREKNDTTDLEALFVVAGTNVKENSHINDVKWIKELKRQGVQLGATSTGTILLAQAEVLKNNRCTGMDPVS